MKPDNCLKLRSTGVLALLLAGALVAGCSGRDAELDHFIAATKKEPGGRVEPLPEIKPYDTFTYASSSMRSPFVPGGSGASSAPGIRPESRRNREFLEQFSLDTLRMVGTLKLHGRNYGLVQTNDGLVHRVLPGNHMGQADGRITAVDDGQISLVEIIPDGMGGFIERPAALALSD